MTTRILALVSDCYGSAGGIARYNQDLFEALAGDAAALVVLPRNAEAGGHTAPAAVEQLPAVSGRLHYGIVALWTAWQRGPFDVVFCGHAFMAPLAWVIARMLGARYWMQAHGTDIWSDRRDIVRRAIEAADMVTTVSRATRRSLLAWTTLTPDRIRVLPDTVGDEFKPGPAPAGLAERLKLGPGPRLLTVARLAGNERYKGHELVFAALPALRTRFPNIVHVVAGDGDDRARLEARALELTGDPSAVRFVGFIAGQDLPNLYRLADLYVMPSTQEGFGIVYLEAAACGLRVVGAAAGGSADAIPDRRVGIRVDPSDREALVAAIVNQLGQGRADVIAVEPYRRVHFAAAARSLLARLTARPWRMTVKA